MTTTTTSTNTNTNANANTNAMNKNETNAIMSELQQSQTLSDSNKYVSKEFSKWEDLENFSPELLRGIYAYGFDKPSIIQQKSILSIFDKKDIIAQAQSGTGKTGAFTVGVLQNIDTSVNKVQAVILVPTRELAKQIQDVVTNLGTFMKLLKIQLLVGGTSTEQDVHALKNNTPHIIVGCPGRVHDMMRRQHIRGADVNIIILDEADEMLSVGFKEQVYNIFNFLNSNVQVGLFSATLPEELHTLSEKFLRNPVKILVKSEQLTLEGIVQHMIALEDDSQKYSTLKDIYNMLAVTQSIIYCNSIKRVVDLNEAMLQDNFPVCCIHSGMEKHERDAAFSDFKCGKHRVLISSNVTARGIDVQNVGVVINFDVPKDVHTYLHRIGRSGRWGRKGIAINFVTRWDLKKIKEFEVYYQTTITEMPATLNVSS
jgi:superfamily II DNA/RNA helicase